MHIPHIYRVDNNEKIFSFIQKNSFALLISSHDNIPCATSIPLLVKNKDTLYGHISLENPQREHIKNGTDVLCVFQGAHGYISSGWYEKEEVPTWNYQAVQIRGTVVIHNSEQTHQHLIKMVDYYEKGKENPVKVEELSDKTMNQMKGILSFEIKIREVYAAFKFSQNRNPTDFKNILIELEKSGDIELAEAMRKNNSCTKT